MTYDGWFKMDLECDECGRIGLEEGSYPITWSELKAEAKDDGWLLKKDGSCLCFNCNPKNKDKGAKI